MTWPVDRRIVVLAMACVVETVACLAVYEITGRWLFRSFVWNLFLAVLPLVASLVAERYGSRRPWVGWVACVVWLPLFPNTVYVTTDLIHLHRVSFGGDKDSSWPFLRYSDDLAAWLQLFVLAGLVFVALYLGLWSLSHMQAFWSARWGRPWALVAVVGASVACGYGIYLGRFARANSWEVLAPNTLVPTLVDSANTFAIAFAGLVAAYLLLAYALFHAFADPSPVQLGAPRHDTPGTPD
ncbi:MAG: DUF1361 domain-containing protein [Micrococcales bacterium]|nr:DUF1361 domain-containing protein [Micrococcales bacterium]MCL2667940.1 DUF1361 domain-containing protein [Micrococcales bacterium]